MDAHKGSDGRRTEANTGENSTDGSIVERGRNGMVGRVVDVRCRGCTWERHRRMDEIVWREVRDLGPEEIS